MTFLTGITIIQVLVGLVSILLTLGTAYLLNLISPVPFWLFLLVCILTCLSVIGFSLILAGLTKSVNEVLVVGQLSPVPFHVLFRDYVPHTGGDPFYPGKL